MVVCKKVDRWIVSPIGPEKSWASSARGHPPRSTTQQVQPTAAATANPHLAQHIKAWHKPPARQQQPHLRILFQFSPTWHCDGRSTVWPAVWPTIEALHKLAIQPLTVQSLTQSTTSQSLASWFLQPTQRISSQAEPVEHRLRPRPRPRLRPGSLLSMRQSTLALSPVIILTKRSTAPIPSLPTISQHKLIRSSLPRPTHPPLSPTRPRHGPRPCEGTVWRARLNKRAPCPAPGSRNKRRPPLVIQQGGRQAGRFGWCDRRREEDRACDSAHRQGLIRLDRRSRNKHSGNEPPVGQLGSSERTRQWGVGWKDLVVPVGTNLARLDGHSSLPKLKLTNHKLPTRPLSRSSVG